MNFISKNLQDAFNKASPVLEKITETQDQISKEIIFLEQSLKTFAISDNFTCIIKSPYDSSSFIDADIGEHCLTGTAVTSEESLIWDKDKKRLMYQLDQYEADVDFESRFPVTLRVETRKTILSKPLIETIFEVRKEIYEEEYLAKFFIELTNKYLVALKEATDPEEIPF